MGKGYELRERRTWPLYPLETRAALVAMPIHLPLWFPESLDQWESHDWPGREDCPVKEGTFLIGNHADEITVRRSRCSTLRLTGNTALDTPSLPPPANSGPPHFSALLPSHPRRDVRPIDFPPFASSPHPFWRIRRRPRARTKSV